MRSSSASNSASESSENRFASADAVNDMSIDYAGLPKPRSSNATAALMRADSDLPALAIFTKVRSAEKAYDLGAERGPHPLDPTVHGDKAHGFEHPHSRDHGAPAHPGKCRQGVIARRQIAIALVHDVEEDFEQAHRRPPPRRPHACP